MLLDNIKNIKYTIKDENRDEYNVKDIYRIYLNDRQIWEKTEDVENLKIKQTPNYHYPLEIIWASDADVSLSDANLIMEPLVMDFPSLLADIYWNSDSSIPSISNYSGGLIEYNYSGKLPSEIHMVIDSKKWPFGCFIDTLKLYDHGNFSNNNESYYKIQKIKIGGGIEKVTKANRNMKFLDPFYLTPGILINSDNEDNEVLGSIYHLTPIKPGLFNNINTLKTICFMDSARIIPKNLITSSSVEKIVIDSKVEEIGVNAIKVTNVTGANNKREVKLQFESNNKIPRLSANAGSIVGECENIDFKCYCHTELLKDDNGDWDNEKLNAINTLFGTIKEYKIYDIDKPEDDEKRFITIRNN